MRAAVSAVLLGVGAFAAESTTAFNCGSDTGITGLDGIFYAPDQPYAVGSGGGYVGGDSVSWEGVGMHHDWGWVELRIYKTLRTGDHSYMFETTPGQHELTLRWVDAESNGPDSRLVDVRLDGITVVSALDIYREVGKSRSLDIRRVVSIADTTALVEIISLEGGSNLAGIALAPVTPSDPLPAPDAIDVRPTYGGALVTWSGTENKHLAGYRATMLDDGRHVALPLDRHAPFVIPAGDSTSTLFIEPIDSRGRPGARATVRNVCALPLPGSSPLRLAQLYVATEDLREMEGALPEKMRKPADLWVDGVRRLGEVNFRGNNTLLLPKKSYKFRIDTGFDVDGSDRVSLSSNFLDRTLIKETMAYEVLTAIGHPSYRSYPWRLMLNDDYAGVFQYIEEPDEIYFGRIRFDPHGRSYKARQMCAKASQLADYIFRYENTNAKDRYRRDVIRLMHEMESVDDPDFEAWVRSTFDLDQILYWYSGQVYIGNHDFMCNNQILYRGRLGGPWKILACDMDNILHEVSDPANYGNRENPNHTGQWSLLVDRMLSVPSLMRRHLEHLEGLLDGPLAESTVLALFDEWTNAIVADAEIDVAKYTREQLDPYHEFVDELRVFFEERSTYLRASIDELMPLQWCDLVINEVVRDTAAKTGPRSVSQSAVELHYRGRSALVADDLYLSNDVDSLLKWPIPSSTLLEGDLLTLDLPEEIEVGDWIGLTVAAPILVVDSLTVGGMLVERSIGRFPDGSGRTRVLSEATPGQPNRWEEPLTVVATPEEEIYYAGEEVRVDLWVTNRWRDTIAVDLEVEVVCPGGVWCLEAPIDTVSIPVLAAGDSAFASFEDSIPELMAPENEGRYDIVFTPVESKGQPLEPGVATIYVLGESFGTAMINEFCASNQSVVADEDGEFEDWVEIVNAADSTISTANLYLSDDAEDEPFKWALPSLDLEPSEHLLIWLDNEPTEGPLHASFKLDREGEEIGLIQETADSVLVLDRIPFGYQEKDWSYGRYPDSARNWELFGWPTPAATNLDPVLRY